MKKGVEIFVSLLVGGVTTGMVVKKLWLAKYCQQKETLDILKRERDLLRRWLFLEQNDWKCSEYFTSRGFRQVAIFGLNWIGRHLADSLGTLAVYGVELDNPSAVHERMTVYRLGDDPLPWADCMVVCDLSWTVETERMVRNEFTTEIVQLEEVLNDLQKQGFTHPSNKGESQ